MRLFAPLLALILAAAVGYLVFAAFARSGQRSVSREQSMARWQVRHTGTGGTTTVAVALMSPGGEVLDQHVVETFSDKVPDWNDRFLRAKQEAEERAFHLNADIGHA